MSVTTVINTELKGSIDQLNRCFDALEKSADPKNCTIPKIAQQKMSRVEAFDQYKKEGKDNFIRAYHTFLSSASQEGIASLNNDLEKYDKSVSKKAAETLKKGKKVEPLNEKVSVGKVMALARGFSEARKMLRDTAEKTDIRAALNPLEERIYTQLKEYQGPGIERVATLMQEVRQQKYPQYVVDRVENFAKKWQSKQEKKASQV